MRVALVLPLCVASCASAPAPVETSAPPSQQASEPKANRLYRGNPKEIGRQLGDERLRADRAAAALDGRVRELGRPRVRYEQAMLYAALAAKLQAVERWQVELFSDEDEGKLQATEACEDPELRRMAAFSRAAMEGGWKNFCWRELEVLAREIARYGTLALAEAGLEADEQRRLQHLLGEIERRYGSFWLERQLEAAGIPYESRPRALRPETDSTCELKGRRRRVPPQPALSRHPHWQVPWDPQPPAPPPIPPE